MTTLMASRLKMRRLALGLSQKELAQGICEQGQISRIEKGNYSPGAELLYTLSQRLGVSLDYFFNPEIDEDQAENLKQFEKLTSQFAQKRDYESMAYLYQLELPKLPKLSIRDKNYMKRVEAILLYYHKGQLEPAIEKMEELLSTISKADAQYLDFATTLVNLYYTAKDFTAYESLSREIKASFEKANFDKKSDLETYIRFRYNYCFHLWELEKDDEALEETTQLLAFIKSNNSIYCLADTYVVLGNVGEKFLEKEKIKEYYEFAKLLYSITDSEELSLKVDKYLKENYYD